MSQSLANVLVHFVFSTKERHAWIKPEIEGKLHSYMAGIFKKCDCPPIIVGGAKDHVHILCPLSKKYSMSQVMEKVKTGSSKWAKTQGAEFKKFYWQNGYGAFGACPSIKETTIKYIKNQKKHHEKKTFKEEYLSFLKKYEINFDERYIWD